MLDCTKRRTPPSGLNLNAAKAKYVPRTYNRFILPSQPEACHVEDVDVTLLKSGAALDNCPTRPQHCFHVREAELHHTSVGSPTPWQQGKFSYSRPKDMNADIARAAHKWTMWALMGGSAASTGKLGEGELTMTQTPDSGMSVDALSLLPVLHYTKVAGSSVTILDSSSAISSPSSYSVASAADDDCCSSGIASCPFNVDYSVSDQRIATPMMSLKCWTPRRHSLAQLSTEAPPRQASQAFLPDLEASVTRTLIEAQAASQEHKLLKRAQSLRQSLGQIRHDAPGFGTKSPTRSGSDASMSGGAGDDDPAYYDWSPSRSSVSSESSTASSWLSESDPALKISNATEKSSLDHESLCLMSDRAGTKPSSKIDWESARQPLLDHSEKLATLKRPPMAHLGSSSSLWSLPVPARRDLQEHLPTLRCSATQCGIELSSDVSRWRWSDEVDTMPESRWAPRSSSSRRRSTNTLPSSTQVALVTQRRTNHTESSIHLPGSRARRAASLRISLPTMRSIGNRLIAVGDV